MSSSDNRTRFFTGRQVTTMVVALMATIVLLPGAVWAVDAFSNVAIQDPVTGHKAQVNSAGALRVGDGGGALTVDGAVTATPAKPADFRSYNANAINPGCHVLGAAPANKAIVLMTLNFAVSANPSPSEFDYFRIHKGTSCAGNTIVGVIFPPSLGQTTLPLDPGFVSKSGFSVWAGGNVEANIIGTGYLVPSAGLP